MSRSSDTRDAVEMFGRDTERNLRKIQRRLRDGTFEFEPQTGILKKKASGGKRGIVMASVHNRVVERAWLDCLQSRCEFVQAVVNQPTSVGGVPNRSVPHGLKLIYEAFEADKRFFVRSDISGFFDNIPRHDVLAKLTEHVDDPSFMEVLTTATTVVLHNESTLGEDRRVFPTDEQGVAQGSPLSPLFGNILLQNFDQEFNKRDIVCVRFIDDFVLLGRDKASVCKAFEHARGMLGAMKLSCHDPFVGMKATDKAAHGAVEDGFVFLGYDIRPGLFQPSKPARQRLLGMVDEHIRFGRHAIEDIKRGRISPVGTQRYAQTLVKLDKVVRGWGDAFAYTGTCSTMRDLDEAISDKLDVFRQWFARQIENKDRKTKRRLGGVCLLEDVPSKTLDDVPFTVETGKRFVCRPTTVTISTDGALASQASRRGREKGPGGWAYVVHDTGQEQFGHSASATNNQMELRAVIEAIRGVDAKRSVIVRTDSQYVSNAVNSETTMKSNRSLWDEYRALAKDRAVKVVWVKGHAGDPNNERADTLAAQAANFARNEQRASPADHVLVG